VAAAMSVLQQLIASYEAFYFVEIYSGAFKSVLMTEDWTALMVQFLAGI